MEHAAVQAKIAEPRHIASDLASSAHYFLQPTAPRRAAPPLKLVPMSPRQQRLQASLAELLLVNRLKAHSHSAEAGDTMARAAQILSVTCRNWFSSTYREAS